MSAYRQRQEQRKKIIKPGIDVDESRRKREENSTEIRKQSREQSLAKKRNLAASLNAERRTLDASTQQKVCH
jgi:hypothetical protein